MPIIVRLFLSSLLIFLVAENTFSQNWCVDGDGDKDCVKIQGAVNAATDGDKIVVHPGIYLENIVLNKSLILEGIGYPVIDANLRGIPLRIGKHNCTVSGFKITGCPSSRKLGAITIESDNNIIRDNKIHYNDDGGIAICSGSSNNTIANNEINLAGDYGIGLTIGTTGNQIINNRISNVTDGCGIIIDAATSDRSYANYIGDNAISSCRRAGIGFEHASDNIVNANYILDSEYGVFLNNESDHNTIISNNISNNNYGIYIDSESSKNKIYCNNLENRTNAYDKSCTNLWDKDGRGNWWSDHTGADSDNDGIGDTVYKIPGRCGAKDMYPLMKRNTLKSDSVWLNSLAPAVIAILSSPIPK